MSSLKTGSGTRSAWFLAGTVLAIGFLCLSGRTTLAAEELVEERSSNYNNIYVYRDGPLVSLTFGHNKRFYTESIYDTRNELALPVPYTQFMTTGLAYTGDVSNILEIGFGGGRTTWYLHNYLPKAIIKSVELDPVVFEMATKYFGIKADGTFSVEVADGRSYLIRNKDAWDIIMIDAYRGPFVPFHLLTTEFFQLVKTRLKPGGAVVQNIEPSTMMFDSAIATIKKAFDNVDIYEAEGNVVAVAYDGPPRSQADLEARAKTIQGDKNFIYPLPDMVAKRRILNKSIPAQVLTDDFAPVESLLAIERHNKKIDALTSEPAR